MKQLCVMVLLLLMGIQVDAKHIMGGAISYRFIEASGEEEMYEVTLRLYAYCNDGQGGASYMMAGRRPKIKIYKGMQSSLEQVFLAYDAARSSTNISPICPDEADRTTCTGALEPYPGILQFTYSGNVIIKGKDENWHFAFNSHIAMSPGPLGYAGFWELMQNVNTEISPFGDPERSHQMYLEATLNNTLGPNNSTEYNDGYAPFFCQNKPAIYSPGGRDPDNDLLVYQLVPARVLGSPVVQSPREAADLGYIAPYTATRPLAAAPGSFLFNSESGEIHFLPNQTGNNMVVYQVDEYRKGIKMGSTQKAVVFITIDNCDNEAARGLVGEVEELDTSRDAGGSLIFSQCEGWDKELKINITGIDPNLDNIRITAGTLPDQATFIVEDNNTQAPKARFRWLAAQAKPGRYTLNLTYTDDGCPLMATQTTAYTIDIRPRPEVQLPADTTLCTGMPLRIETLLQAGTRYSWSAGDTTNYMVITRPDDYTLRATNACGTSMDQIRINYIDCHYCLFVPNAFTPNGDGNNDRFLIKAVCPFRTFKLQLFNRYGQRLFTSLTLDKTWDGTFNGRVVDPGDYFYVIDVQYLNASDGPARSKGSVTVLR